MITEQEAWAEMAARWRAEMGAVLARTLEFRRRFEGDSEQGRSWRCSNSIRWCGLVSVTAAPRKGESIEAAILRTRREIQGATGELKRIISYLTPTRDWSW